MCREKSNVDRTGEIQQANAQDAQDELMNLLTIMYIVVQETLNDPEDMASTEAKLRMYHICRGHASSVARRRRTRC